MSSKIGTVLIDVAADVSKLVDGFNKAQKESKEKSEKIVGYAKNITGALAGIASIGAMNALIRGTLDAADATNDLSEKLGMSANALSRLEYSASFAAVKIETLETAMTAMILRTELFKRDGGGAAADAMQQLGISTEFARKNFVDTSTTFKILLERLGEVKDATLKTTLTQELFGKSGTDMVRLVNQGSASLEELADQGERIGAVFSDDMAKSAAELNDNIDAMTARAKGLRNSFVNFLIPSLNEATKSMNSFFDNTPSEYATEIDFLTATASRSVDMLNVLWEVVENGGQDAIYSLNLAVYGFGAGISKMALSVSESLNSIGFLSDKELEQNKKLTEWLDSGYKDAQQGIASGNIEILEAMKKANITIEERIELYKKEREALKQNSKSSDPKASINKDRTTNKTKEQISLEENYYKELRKLQEDNNSFYLDGLAKEALATYQHYEDLIERYKGVAGAKNSLLLLQDKALQNLETKQLKEINEEKLKLEKSFADEAMALVDKKNSYFLDGLAKEAFESFNHYNDLIEKYKEVSGAEEALRVMQGEALDDINEKIKEQNELLEQSKLLNSLDEINDRYQKILDSQISLIEAGQDWGISFSGDAKNIDNVSKSISKMHLISIKYTKADLDLQNDYAKKFLAANGDIVKEKQLETEFDADSAKIKEQQHTSEIAGYATLAGSMSQSFAEGSDAAKAFMAVQQGLSLYNGVTAVLGAWASAPFPANLPAVAATTVAVAGLLAQIGQSFGGSGGGSAPTENFEANRQNIEDTYTPMTDRLDRQIELLESIDRQGSASAISAELAGVNFARDYKLWIEDTLENARLSGATKLTLAQTQAAMGNVEGVSGVDIYSANANGSQISLNTDMLREDFNMLKALIATINTGGWGLLGQKDLTGSESERWQQQQTQMTLDINEAQNLISEWALGIVESMDDLKDAAKDFKGYYDDITGLMFYETARLKQAYKEVDTLRGENSFVDYLQQTVNSIEGLQTFFNDEVFTLLSSQNINDIEAQIAKVEELQTVTGETFEGGAREALNYLESIELVSEAMAKNRENIKSFTDSLLTDEQLAKNLASSLGVGLATSVDGLAALFYDLSEDMDGLTDSDLDLLNANKALLENTDAYQTQIDDLNITLDDAVGGISTLEGALGTITSTVDKLRGASKTSEQSLQDFYDAMSNAQALSLSNQYEEYANAIKRVTDASSVLFNISAFQTTPDMDMLSARRDMEFAQLVAANQFETLQDTTMEEIDHLRQIEINTANTVSALVAAMNSLGSNVSSSLSSAISSIGQAKTSTSATASYIGDIYTKYDLNKYQTDTSGYAYWEQQVSSGAVAVQDLDAAIKTAAMKRLMYTPFADGGLVKGGMGGTIGLIGEKDYDEIVLPLKNPDDPLSMGMLVKEIRDLKNQVAQLLKENNNNQAQISKNTAASRYAS